MSRKKDSDKSIQQKNGLSEWIKLRITEANIYEYMKTPGKRWKALDEELDDRNIKEVPLQDFYLRIKTRQEEIGECFVWCDYDASRKGDKKRINKESKRVKKNVHSMSDGEMDNYIGTLFEGLIS